MNHILLGSRVQIDAGYNEKMDILIFKPKNSNFEIFDSVILYPTPPEIQITQDSS